MHSSVSRIRTSASSSASLDTSYIVTDSARCASTCAMPCPIRPAPTTAAANLRSLNGRGRLAEASPASHKLFGPLARDTAQPDADLPVGQADIVPKTGGLDLAGGARFPTRMPSLPFATRCGPSSSPRPAPSAAWSASACRLPGARNLVCSVPTRFGKNAASILWMTRSPRYSYFPQ